MTAGYHGLFVGEGSSDEPLADIVEDLFLDRGLRLRLTRPDYGLLPDARVKKDVTSKITAGLRLVAGPIDVLVVHRDADSAGAAARTDEITRAASGTPVVPVVCVVPVRMTEAWLLLDEPAIRMVAGNPNGRVRLNLPKPHQAEALADPKAALRECLIAAAEVTGKRRDRSARRFDEHRRQLLSSIDRAGRVTALTSWQALLVHVDAAVAALG